MDKNKTIIVILSIVIVVVAASGVALWFLYPKIPGGVANAGSGGVQYAAGLSSPAPDAGTNASSTVTAATPIPSSGPSVVNQQVLIVDGSNTDYRVGPDGKLIAATPNPAASAAPSPSPASGLVVSGGATPAPSPSPKPQASLSPAKTAKPASSKLPSAAPQVAPARHGNVVYWIQVISSPNKDRVEQIKAMIGGYGFKGLMSQYNKNGSDFYRLRYGPYYDKEEANKFLDWVKVIKGFETSYIVPDKLKPAK